MSTKICSVNHGAFEFPFNFFGEQLNKNVFQDNTPVFLSITTILATNDVETEAAHNFDYMKNMINLFDMDIEYIELFKVNENGERILITDYDNYKRVIDLHTDCPDEDVEHMFRGHLRLGMDAQ